MMLPRRFFLVTVLCSQTLLPSAIAKANIEARKYIKVCPVGQTTNCRQIGYSDPTPPAIETNVVIPSKYIPGQDYTFSEIAPAITAPPPSGATGPLTHYTSYEQVTNSKNLVIIPVVVPIPVGEPIPPEIPPSDAPETLDLPKGSESPASQPPTSTARTNQPTSSGARTTGNGGSCTRPTPAAQSPPVSPVSQTGVTATDPDAGPNTGITTSTGGPKGPETSPPATSTGRCPASSPTSPIPGCWGQPGCAYVIASDLGAGAACPANYCNCGGTVAPLLTATLSGSQSLGCDYTTQPASNACPAGPTVSKSVVSINTGYVLNPSVFPTVTGSACFKPVSTTPSGQASFYATSASDSISAACYSATHVPTNYPPQPTAKFTYQYFPGVDDPNLPDSRTSLFAKIINGDSINESNCVTGFINALSGCPIDEGGFSWGGAVSYNGVEYSVWAVNDHLSQPNLKRTLRLGPQQIELPQSSPRETHLYAYAGCPEANGCDTGYVIADHYSFSPTSICDKDSSEISYHSIDSASKTDIHFKSFGHDGCRLDPSLDSGSAKGLYGTLDCGGNLKGQCLIPSKAEATAQLCVEDLSDRNAVKNGTVFQMMAVCRF